jgi:2-dehydro-3-deoxy-D-arabinonate dehydratase
MKLYRISSGPVAETEKGFFRITNAEWNNLLTRDDLRSYLEEAVAQAPASNQPAASELLAPIGAQEVWAAGVTYYRSRTARMEESQGAGGGSFYDRVYEAPRPELFFKATAQRVVGPGANVHIRSDSKWNVPEPELTLLISPSGKLIGYTAGNDMSSRDIEGENPLYLPQAKVYERSCALGPCILVQEDALPSETRIRLEINRNGSIAFSDETTLTQLKRTANTLIEYLYRENTFPEGCFLLTGTGIVPPDNFTLQPGDRTYITIDGIGTLENQVD